MRIFTILVALLVAAHTISGQTTAPAILWQKLLGGNLAEEARFLQLTPDGGCVFTGYARSANGDVTVNKGDDDLWVVKLDENGAMQWQHTYGGTGQEWGRHIQLTADGGYILAGHNTTANENGDIHGNKGGFDYWILKLNYTGQLEWQKSLGGSSLDLAYRIQQTADGNYVVFGGTKSIDGDITGKITSDADYWLVKLDPEGSILWEKTIGGIGHEEGSSIELTDDGGFILSGFTDSNNGDVTGNHGDFDAHLVKTDNDGNIQWSRCYGGMYNDAARDARQTADGGYIMTGYTNSNDGDVSGNHGGQDAWVVKLDADGLIQWQKTLGGTSLEYAYYIEQARDNSGYLVTGHNGSDNGDVSDNHGLYDCWAVKIDAGGNLLWQKSLGGSEQDYGRAITQTYTGDYLIGGYASSIDGDVTGKHGGPGSKDAWIIKLQGNCVLQPYYQDSDGDSYGNPAVSKMSCISPPGFVLNSSDCNDGFISIHPGAEELFNGFDDDCDIDIDEGFRSAIYGSTLVAGVENILTCSNAISGFFGADMDSARTNEKQMESGMEKENTGNSLSEYSPDHTSGYSGFTGYRNDSEKQSLNIYPNPVTAEILVSIFSDKPIVAQITLLDAIGKPIAIITKAEFAVGNHEIAFNRGSFETGVYFIQLRTKTGTIIKKLFFAPN
jgi:hypothetical protein